MENLHIILLSSIISILFLVFIIATYREMIQMESKPYDGGKEGGPRAELLDLIAKLMNEKP